MVHEGRAVLGHDQREPAGPLVDPPQEAGQRVRCLFPAERRQRPLRGQHVHPPQRRQRAVARRLRVLERRDTRRGVVVHAQPVDRGRDGFGIAVVDPVGQPAGGGQHVLRIAAAQHRVEEEPVVDAVELAGRFAVGRGVAVRDGRGEVQGQRELVLRPGERARRQAVREQQVVGRDERRVVVLDARGVHAAAVAEERGAERLVDRRPVAHAVAECAVDDRRVVGEPGSRVTLRPAAGVLQGLRQVPVVERQHRRDTVAQHLVDQPVVEGEPGRGRRPAVRLHPRPRDGEPVGVESQVGQQADVLGVAVVVVAGDSTGRAVEHLASGRREGVPDGRSAAAFGDAALHLVGRRRRAPEKACREGHTGAPFRMPRTRWRPSSRNSAMTGTTARVAPVSISA